MNEAFSLISTALAASLSWFSQIINKGNLGGYLLAAAFISLSWRFLLAPIFEKGIDSGSD